MARGVRKSPREKLQERLCGIEEAMTQYSQCLEKLKAEKRDVEEEMERLELAELNEILKEKHLSVTELRNLVNGAGA